jgi:hypothetical protein
VKKLFSFSGLTQSGLHTYSAGSSSTHALLEVLEKNDAASLCAATQRTPLWLNTRNHPAKATGAKPGQRTFAKVVRAVHKRTRLSLPISLQRRCRK